MTLFMCYNYSNLETVIIIFSYDQWIYNKSTHRSKPASLVTNTHDNIYNIKLFCPLSCPNSCVCLLCDHNQHTFRQETTYIQHCFIALHFSSDTLWSNWFKEVISVELHSWTYGEGIGVFFQNGFSCPDACFIRFP
jgi:hypothetical protein